MVKKSKWFADEQWKQKVEILMQIARGDKKTQIAAQFGCDEKHVRDIDKEARKYPSWVVRELPPRVQDYLASVNPELKSELTKTKGVQEESWWKIEDPVLVQRRKEHWDDLALLVNLLVSYWIRSVDYSSQIGKHELIINEEESDEIDLLLANSLVAHLKAEFSEFQKVKSWQDLVRLDLIEPDNIGALGVLELVGRRKTFKGKCLICESY